MRRKVELSVLAKRGARIKSLLILFLLSVLFGGAVSADLSDYTYPYEISRLDWFLLNWTAAYRGTTIITEPFTLERMEYDRTQRQVIVYVRTPSGQGTEEDRQRAITNISTFFRKTFPEFDAAKDMVLYCNN